MGETKTKISSVTIEVGEVIVTITRKEVKAALDAKIKDYSDAVKFVNQVGSVSKAACDVVESIEKVKKAREKWESLQAKDKEGIESPAMKIEEIKVIVKEELEVILVNLYQASSTNS